MEVNDLIALREINDDHRCGCYDDYYHRRLNGGTATALAAGFGALGVAVVGLLGIYAYNNMQGKFTTQLVNQNAAQIGMLNTTLLNEAAVRQSNENAMRNEYTTSASRLSDQITITNNAATSANAAANSWADAQSTLASGVLNGTYQNCGQKVMLYSAPSPCSCPNGTTCGCGCNG